MKPMAIGLLGAVMLMLGVAAAIANVSAGTDVHPMDVRPPQDAPREDVVRRVMLHHRAGHVLLEGHVVTPA